MKTGVKPDDHEHFAGCLEVPRKEPGAGLSARTPLRLGRGLERMEKMRVGTEAELL